MTERQKALLKNLPKCNNNLSKAAKMSGYGDNYATSGIYQDIRKPTNRINKIMGDEEKIKEKYIRETRKLKKRFLSEKDNTNASRMHEIEGRTQGLTKDTVVNEGNPREIVVNYGIQPTKEVLQPIVSKDVTENKAS